LKFKTELNLDNKRKYNFTGFTTFLPGSKKIQVKNEIMHRRNKFFPMQQF